MNMTFLVVENEKDEDSFRFMPMKIFIGDDNHYGKALLSKKLRI